MKTHRKSGQLCRKLELLLWHYDFITRSVNNLSPVGLRIAAVTVSGFAILVSLLFTQFLPWLYPIISDRNQMSLILFVRLTLVSLCPKLTTVKIHNGRRQKSEKNSPKSKLFLSTHTIRSKIFLLLLLKNSASVFLKNLLLIQQSHYIK